MGKYGMAKLSGLIRIVVEEKADELILADLKPGYIQSSPENPRYNHVKDIYAKWQGSYFYFYAIYSDPYLNDISTTFDSGFARMEYIGENQFNLSSMRHTGQWREIYSGLSLDECLMKIRDKGCFWM